MLHDVVEDTPASIDRVREDFGPEVARIVEGVTKIGRLKSSSRKNTRPRTSARWFWPWWMTSAWSW